MNQQILARRIIGFTILLVLIIYQASVLSDMPTLDPVRYPPVNYEVINNRNLQIKGVGVYLLGVQIGTVEGTESELASIDLAYKVQLALLFLLSWMAMYFLVRKKQERTAKATMRDVVIFCFFCLFAVLVIGGSM